MSVTLLVFLKQMVRKTGGFQTLCLPTWSMEVKVIFLGLSCSEFY